MKKDIKNHPFLVHGKKHREDFFNQLEKEKSLRDVYFAWYELFRPQCVDEIILPNRIKEEFSNGVHKHYLFANEAYGIGKTTLMYALANESNKEYKVWNGSTSRGMDTVRDEIIPYGETPSMHSQGKLILIDEFDKFTSDAQDALRNFMETSARKVCFLCTGNYGNKIKGAIDDRITRVDFNLSKAEETERITAYKNRIKGLLSKYSDISITDDRNGDNALGMLLKKTYPSFRSALKNLQTTATQLPEGKCIIEEKDLCFNTSKIDKDIDLYNFICEAYIPEKIMSFVKPRYVGTESEALKTLSTPFLDWLNDNKKYQYVGAVAAEVSVFDHYMQNSTDKLNTLVGCIYKLTQICK